MRTSCQDVEAMIDREARGWSEAERLRVESHLVTCPSCEQTLLSVRFVRETLLEASAPLTEQARERAIGRAFAQHVVRKDRHPVGRSIYLPLAGLVAAAAAALLFWLSRAPEVTGVPGAELAQQQPAPVSAPTPELAEESVVETQAPERRRFAHATVDLAAHTRVRFDRQKSTLALERGSVSVDVDVSAGRAFGVTTENFRVQVLGTRFSVTPRTVVVVHGRVQVFGHDGSVLARELGAGASFSYTEPHSIDAGPAAAVSEVAPEPASVSVRSLLSRAREALARADTAAARQLVARAEREQPVRSERAEAATLQAEADLLDKNFKGALRTYVSVAERFSELAAGDNAAFAAVQLAARVEPTRERALIESYLARHPQGRFASEAKQRLDKLAR